MTRTDRPFDHVLLIMFENQYRGYVMENPYFQRLAKEGIDLANAFGVMHPSQTNYIASIAGELCNVTDDEAPSPLLPQRTIVDLVEAAGLDWRAYMDGYSPQLAPWSPDLVPADQYPYVIKHDPFSSYENVVRDEKRWAKIVSQHQFFTDVASGDLPEYAWFTPDMWNDGHYLRGTHSEPAARAPALVDQAADWLEWFFGALKFPGPDSLLPPRTLVVVNFDEADFEAAWAVGKKYTYDGPNQIYTVLLGDGIEPGVERDEGYNHYSVLRTVEKNFDLGDLGKNDTDSNWLRFLWGERFCWAAPAPTPIKPAGAVAAAGLGDDLHVAYRTAAGVAHRSWDGAVWSSETVLGGDIAGPLALASLGDELVLVEARAGGGASERRLAAGSGWSAPSAVLEGPVGALALAPCNRGADLMLAWTGEQGSIRSIRWTGSWSTVFVTAHSSRGDLALTALGHCLLLVFQADDGGGLTAVTYNTARFNTTTVPETKWAGTYDDAIVDAWSPSGAPVAHFAAASTAATPGEPEPLLQPYRGAAPLAAATLDGVVHLVHPPENGVGLVGERFSIAGLLTPKLPVSYRAGDGSTTSNGYGTLAEAGWTPQTPLEGIAQAPGAGLALARRGDELDLLSQDAAGGGLELAVGRWVKSR